MWHLQIPLHPAHLPPTLISAPGTPSKPITPIRHGTGLHAAREGVGIPVGNICRLARARVVDAAKMEKLYPAGRLQLRICRAGAR